MRLALRSEVKSKSLTVQFEVPRVKELLPQCNHDVVERFCEINEQRKARIMRQVIILVIRRLVDLCTPSSTPRGRAASLGTPPPITL